MKKKFYLALALAMALALLMTTIAAAAGYDTKNDPIVVYSGLVKWAEETFRPSINQSITSTVDPLKTQLADAMTRLATAESAIADLQTENKALKDANDALQTKLDSVGAGSGSGAGSTYTVIYLTEGTSLLATTVCSIILRSGQATVVSPFAAQGVTDVSDGVELLADAPLTVNHEIIVPRGNDGRGVRIVSAGGAYILVQGGYTLVEP